MKRDVCLCGASKDARAKRCWACSGRPPVDWHARPVRVFPDPLIRFLGQLHPQPNGCIYYGRGLPDIYGGITVNGERMYAHRYAWFAYYDEYPPADKVILHRCDTPRCVARDHLTLGTKGDNSRDMIAKGRGRGQFGAAA